MWPVPVIVFVAITLICVVAALFSIWRVARIEAAIVFRA
jgi:ABC-type lipoprotein release transport system permease subunit